MLVSASVWWSNHLVCFVPFKAKKENKNTTKNFVGFHKHYPQCINLFLSRAFITDLGVGGGGGGWFCHCILTKIAVP